MAAYLLGRRLYPDQYSVALSRQDLKNLEQPHFHTHLSHLPEKLHQLSEFIFWPGRLNAQLFARIIEPLPGDHKDHPLRGLAIRVGALGL